MVTNTKDTLKSLMREINLNPKVQQELLRCAESGETFPYVPRTLIKTKSKAFEPTETSVFRLPTRPIQRPKNIIESLGDYERDQFRPNPSKTRPPHEKERLQNLMAFGKDIDEELKNICLEQMPKEEASSDVDMFSEILREIKERKDFLDDMTSLGEGKKYLPEIQCQISLRLRELEKIDKERAQLFVQKYNM